MKRNKVVVILTAIVLYVVSVGASSLFFTKISSSAIVNSPLPSPATGAEGNLVFNNNLPKTESCPLNGAMYSKQQKQWWDKHRPLGVMIENHSEARPQSGLSGADVVYEAVAEGGITRFLAIFYCQDAGMIGPIRSARTYFIDFISEYGNSPLYSHVGGAAEPGPADALGQIQDYGWTSYNDLSSFNVPFPIYKKIPDRQGHEVAVEHTTYSTTQDLWNYAATNRKLTNVDEDGKSWDTDFVPYKFKEDAVLSERGKPQSLHLEFWSDQNYAVDWVYDPKINFYLRNNGGVAHIDRDNQKQLSAKTIVVLYMAETHANDGYENNVHLLYADKGSGKEIVFMDGKQVKANWAKKSRTGRMIISDANGNEVQFNKGKLWFDILPMDGVLTVK